MRGSATSYHNNQNSSQNYNVISTKIKMKLKNKKRLYNNLLFKQLVDVFKFLFPKEIKY